MENKEYVTVDRKLLLNATRLCLERRGDGEIQFSGNGLCIFYADYEGEDSWIVWHVLETKPTEFWLHCGMEDVVAWLESLTCDFVELQFLWADDTRFYIADTKNKRLKSFTVNGALKVMEN